MIICYCAFIEFDEIAVAIKNGCTNIDEIRKTTNACTGCGNCKSKINNMIHDFEKNGTLVQEDYKDDMFDD